MKNNLLIKTEIQAFETLINPTRRVRKNKHPIRKVVLNIGHSFFYDFNEKNVFINFEENEDLVYLHYATVAASLVHIFDNAHKYVLSDSRIDVKFSTIGKEFCVEFDMVSFKIFPDEYKQIFQQGFSGKYAKQLSIAGAGMGLALIRKFMTMNKGRFEVLTDCDSNKRTTTVIGDFENNKFRLFFPFKKK
jgi:K+-sensing histidine kinase KdpD